MIDGYDWGAYGKSEPDIWHLPEPVVAVARALDPDAWHWLERIEAVVGIPIPYSDDRTRRLSYEDWQRRVTWTLDAAPRAIGAYLQARLRAQLRIDADFDADLRHGPRPELIDP